MYHKIPTLSAWRSSALKGHTIREPKASALGIKHDRKQSPVGAV